MKETTAALREIIPKDIADSLGPMMVPDLVIHLYGLPKTHKASLSMRRFTLSATGTYNHKLTKWLEKKLKPLNNNGQLLMP